MRVHSFWLLVAGLAAVLLSGPAPAQYSGGDVIVTDQNNIGSNWPLWGVTVQGKVYTVTTNLSFYAWSVAPSPDNRTLWASGKGNLGYTTATIAPDGTITNFNVDLQHLFSCIDVDGGGNAILGNLVGGGTINKYANQTLSTLYSGSPLQSVLGGGIDLTSGDFVFLDSSGPALYRLQMLPKPALSTVLTGLLRPALGFGLHADPASGDMVGSWSVRTPTSTVDAVFRLRLGSPGALTTLRSGSPFGTLGALDRDPFDGQFVIPSQGATSTQPTAVFRFDAANGAITTLATFPSSVRVSPIAATVAGSRHLAAGNEARPGQPFNLIVSSPNEPGAAYIAALSLSPRPGIPLAGRTVYLAPDALFAYSITNSGIFSNFQGALSAKGEAFPRVQIPLAPALSGFRFFAAVITINLNQISVISDTIGVTIR